VRSIGMTKAEACPACGIAGDRHDPLCPAWLLELSGLAGRAERRISEAAADLVKLRHGVDEALRAVTASAQAGTGWRAG
jgi:hypothetical protein